MWRNLAVEERSAAKADRVKPRMSVVISVRARVFIVFSMNCSDVDAEGNSQAAGWQAWHKMGSIQSGGRQIRGARVCDPQRSVLDGRIAIGMATCCGSQ